MAVQSRKRIEIEIVYSDISELFESLTKIKDDITKGHLRNNFTIRTSKSEFSKIDFGFGHVFEKYAEPSKVEILDCGGKKITYRSRMDEI